MRAFVEKQIPSDWQKWPLDRRRMYWGGAVTGAENLMLVERRSVCAAEIWCEALGGNIKDMKNTDTRELNAIVAMMPEWKRTENPIRQGPYGVVRGFRKT